MKFNFVSTNYRDDFLRQFLKFFHASQFLEKLNISDIPRLFDIPEVFNLIINIIESCEGVKSIGLRNNTITQGQFDNLISTLCLRMEHITLDLLDNNLCAIGHTIVADILVQHRIILTGVLHRIIAGVFEIVNSGELTYAEAQSFIDPEAQRLIDEELAKLDLEMLGISYDRVVSD